MAYDMDADRRSAVSSYYRGGNGGERRTSWDQRSQRPPGAASPSLRGHPQKSSAGYNQASFTVPSREEPVRPGRDEGAYDPETPGQDSEGFDVFADFNNIGPKYVSALPSAPDPPPFRASDNRGYRQIRSETKSEAPDPAVELVTVPAFGAEWKAEELRAMTKKGQRDDDNEIKRLKWKHWTRDQYGFCGGWATRKTVVIVAFGLCVFIGVLLAIFIPRVPGFAFNTNTPFLPVNQAIQNGNSSSAEGDEAYKNAFSRVPANFSFPSWLNLQIDTHANILPLHFNSIEVQVYESNTLQMIATGDVYDLTLPAKVYYPMYFPIEFSYQAVNISDLTWLHIYDACKNHVNYVGGVRPGMDVRLLVFMNIAGLPTTAGTSTQISGVPCPIELPTDSV